MHESQRALWVSTLSCSLRRELEKRDGQRLNSATLLSPSSILHPPLIKIKVRYTTCLVMTSFGHDAAERQHI